MKIIKRIFFSSVGIRVITVGLSFISNVIINRSLGLALKGQYTTLVNYANFLQLVLNLGVCYVYPPMKSKDKEESKDIVLSLIWVQFIVLSMFFMISILFIRNYNLFLVGLLSLFMILNGQIIFLALIDNIYSRNISLLLSTILFLIMNVFLVIYFKGDMYLILYILILKNGLECIYICFRNRYFILKKRLINKNNLLMIIKYGIPTAFLAVLISCNYNIDIFMLTWLKSGDVEVGIYGVAYSLSNMLWILPDAFKELIYNKTIKKVEYKVIVKYIKINLFLCFIICIGFLIFGKFFLEFVYGEQYGVAFPVTLTLFFGILPMVAFKLIHPVYVNIGKSKTVVFILGGAVIINIIGSLLFIPFYGALGASLASVFSYLLCGILFYIKFKKDFEERSDAKI
ncbi:oligosaccharide flippase family protein [Thomasclavelia cocleata]|uniref:oligosaccharide flippase family protein n=1 Tax=Thomasclavelia cocleata TaxID=69824 RepID=UPI0025841581|nr:polysaccharide biosynthesis C-terminal domain-containing protein [Thomasclavelia cocleata]